MGLKVRAASIAAASFCIFASLGLTAPTFASDAKVDPIQPVEQSLINEPASEAVPAPAVEPTAQPAVLVQESPSKPTVKARSLRDAVAAQVVPDTLDRETECLAGAVYFEAKGESLEGQLAVAEVVLNRADSGRYPSTACGVVFQRHQFSFVRHGDFPPIKRNSRAWREAIAIAQIAQDDLWESRVSDAMFFHASRVSPGWRKTRIAQVGNHVFYR